MTMSSGETNSSNSDASTISDSETSEASSQSESKPIALTHHVHVHAAITDEYATKVREWTTQVPIGLGLCPWAIKSSNKGLLRIVTCENNAVEGAVEFLENEIQSLTCRSSDNEDAPIPPLSTTLMVCPHVKEWGDFHIFDEFVSSGFKAQLKDSAILDNVTLVAFHPNFLRWYGIPPGIDVGSVVQCHWGIIGRKSVQTAAATVIETNNKAFGSKKVKVRFHDDAVEGLDRQEQFVPTNWIAQSENGPPSPLLPDNAMYQSPYPVIHIIVNEDLTSMSIRDVSRVKRLNARRMAELGWLGLEQRLKKGS